MQKRFYEKYLESSVRDDIEYLSRFIHQNEIQYNQSVGKLEKRFESESSEGYQSDFDREYFGDFFVDEVETLNEIKGLAEQFAIVGLYRIVELNRKKIVTHAYRSQKGKLKTEVKISENINNLQEKILKDFNVNIFQLKCSDSINELRILNNAIKHDDQMIKQQIEDDVFIFEKAKHLSNLKNTFDKLAPIVPEYLKDLMIRLLN